MCIQYQLGIITNMEDLKDLLQSKKIKPTFQRLAILKYLHDHKTHPSVERIYSFLIKQIPTMSRTTIYNTLNMFVQKGLVNLILLSPTEIRYDGDTTFHHHFLCDSCKSIIDIHADCEYGKIGEIQGHKINEVHGYFKGLCHNCQ